jgi:hypothetical protein
MSTFELTRRASLGVFGVVALVCAALSSGALALTHAGAGIHVDVAPLRANGGDPTAAWVAQTLPGALARAFAEQGRPGAAVSVTIDYVMLGAASNRSFGAVLQALDQMVGEVTIDGVAHPLRATSTYYPMAIDQPLFERSNFDRVSRLSQAFAYWVARGY